MRPPFPPAVDNPRKTKRREFRPSARTPARLLEGMGQKVCRGRKAASHGLGDLVGSAVARRRDLFGNTHLWGPNAGLHRASRSAKLTVAYEQCPPPRDRRRL